MHFPTANPTMPHKLMILLLAALMPAVALGEPAGDLPVDGGFESGQLKTPTRRVDAGAKLVREAGGQGQWALQLGEGAVSRCRFQLPVQGDQRYTLRFMGRVRGPGAIAADMAADPEHAVQRLGATRGLAEWNLVFRDKGGQRIKPDHQRFGMKIIDAEWRQYREDFYAPAGARQLELSFSNGSKENAVWIDEVRLAPLAQETLNLNPDFSLGAFNYSGYGSFSVHTSYDPHVRSLRLVQDRKGWFFDCTYGYVMGDPFPAGPGDYRVQFRARRRGARRAAVSLWYYDEAGRRSASSSIRIGGDSWRDYDYKLTLPAGTVRARLLFGDADFEWIRFVPAGETASAKAAAAAGETTR